MEVIFFFICAFLAIALLEEIGFFLVVIVLCVVVAGGDDDEAPKDPVPVQQVVAPNETLETDPKCDSSEVLMITNENGDRECILGGTSY